MKLVLASGSPRRLELIRELGLDFSVRVSNVDEDALVERARPNHPEEIVTLLAEAKARAVAREVQESALVIGADTIVWLDGAALNKPKDADDAVRMLLLLAGRTHEVYTGVAIVRTSECVIQHAVTGYERTEVEFHTISESDIRAYVETGEPMDKAGAYGVQDSSVGKKLVKAVRGDYDNVVGLPLNTLRQLLGMFE